jgi:hypothetical protein
VSAPSRGRRPLPVLGRPIDAAEPGASKPAEPDDPLALVGVPVAIDEATFDEMADVFIDEFVRDGWSDERLLAFFRSPFYAGLHVIWRRRGEAWVRGRIGVARARWRRTPDGGLAAEPAVEAAGVDAAMEEDT